MSLFANAAELAVKNRPEIEDIVAKVGLGTLISIMPDLMRIAATLGSSGDPPQAAQEARTVLLYSEATRARVTAWQAAHGLTVDGLVGDETWSKVEELTAP